MSTLFAPRIHVPKRIDYRAPTERVYDFIVEHKHRHDGNSPTYREIMDGASVSSTSMVRFYLNKLEKQGLIRRPEPPIGERFSVKIEVIGGRWERDEK